MDACGGARPKKKQSKTNSQVGDMPVDSRHQTGDSTKSRKCLRRIQDESLTADNDRVTEVNSDIRKDIDVQNTPTGSTSIAAPDFTQTGSTSITVPDFKLVNRELLVIIQTPLQPCRALCDCGKICGDKANSHVSDFFTLEERPAVKYVENDKKWRKHNKKSCDEKIANVSVKEKWRQSGLALKNYVSEKLGLRSKKVKKSELLSSPVKNVETMDNSFPGYEPQAVDCGPEKLTRSRSLFKYLSNKKDKVSKTFMNGKMKKSSSLEISSSDRPVSSSDISSATSDWSSENASTNQCSSQISSLANGIMCNICTCSPVQESKALNQRNKSKQNDTQMFCKKHKCKKQCKKNKTSKTNNYMSHNCMKFKSDKTGRKDVLNTSDHRDQRTAVDTDSDSTDGKPAGNDTDIIGQRNLKNTRHRRLRNSSTLSSRDSDTTNDTKSYLSESTLNVLSGLQYAIPYLPERFRNRLPVTSDRGPMQTTSGVTSDRGPMQTTSGVTSDRGPVQITSGVTSDRGPVQITSGVTSERGSVQTTSGVTSDHGPVQNTSGVTSDRGLVQITSGVTSERGSVQITGGVTSECGPMQITSGTTAEHGCVLTTNGGLSQAVSVVKSSPGEGTTETRGRDKTAYIGETQNSQLSSLTSGNPCHNVTYDQRSDSKPVKHYRSTESDSVDMMADLAYLHGFETTLEDPFNVRNQPQTDSSNELCSGLLDIVRTADISSIGDIDNVYSETTDDGHNTGLSQGPSTDSDMVDFNTYTMSSSDENNFFSNALLLAGSSDLVEQSDAMSHNLHDFENQSSSVFDTGSNQSTLTGFYDRSRMVDSAGDQSLLHVSDTEYPGYKALNDSFDRMLQDDDSSTSDSPFREHLQSSRSNESGLRSRSSDENIEADDEYECDCEHCQFLLSQHNISGDNVTVATRDNETMTTDGYERGTFDEFHVPFDLGYYTDAAISERDAEQFRSINSWDIGFPFQPNMPLLLSGSPLGELLEDVIEHMLAARPELFLDEQYPPARKDVIDNLPTVGLTLTHIEQNPSCPICLCASELEEIMTVLPCQHIFHPLCIQAWLTKSGTCPVCRRKIRNT